MGSKDERDQFTRAEDFRRECVERAEWLRACSAPLLIAQQREMREQTGLPSIIEADRAADAVALARFKGGKHFLPKTG